ncbi:transporter substrate-binding domain-containing protein [Rhizobium sp. TH2]|uniref:substrate-binding periplasmic protein n=1 Tax=Rhizobium sp. TH2 TaxID=2775403 RepID=UPI0021586A37|nr:transporter substrate-binding domain-containing protein [Rhizobium sp. TH2]UVC07062.1 transporter substrate-binding domain-containing protein [Rhizobium sp. TH2]
MRYLIVTACLLFGSVAQAEDIHLVTEEYPPFAFLEDGKYKGSSVDQVEILMKDAGLDYSMDMMPWARALALAERQPLHCVFTAAHNEERDPHFKWIEPLLAGRTLLIRKAGSKIAPKTIDEAKDYLVGTQRDDFTADLLKKHGFDKLDLAADFNLTLKKLMLGRIDLMPISEDYYGKLRSEGAKIESTLVLSEQIYSIACNKSVPDADIARMQAGLDKLIADGTQAALIKKYGLDTKSQ